MKKINKLYGILLLFLVVFSPLKAFAQDTLADLSAIEKNYLTRGEVVSGIVQAFDLKNREKKYFEDCLSHIQECFFVFSGLSRFQNMQFMPLVLYPDVSVAYRYYEDINLATMLGLVHGYIDEKESPFHPRALMSRIEALKVVLGAAHLMDWKERFELIAALGNEDLLKQQKTPFNDVSAENAVTWWYPRYVNFALDEGIVDHGRVFRPDEFITAAELREMFDRAQNRAKTINY